MNIDLHIEEVVLHGFAPGDRHAIGAAIEQELARLLVEHGVPPGLAQGGAIDQLRGGFNVAPGMRAETIGAQVAQAVYGGLNR